MTGIVLVVINKMAVMQRDIVMAMQRVSLVQLSVPVQQGESLRLDSRGGAPWGLLREGGPLVQGGEAMHMLEERILANGQDIIKMMEQNLTHLLYNNVIVLSKTIVPNSLIKFYHCKKIQTKMALNIFNFYHFFQT